MDEFWYPDADGADSIGDFYNIDEGVPREYPFWEDHEAWDFLAEAKGIVAELAEVKRRRQMPYKDFLRTEYWLMVRAGKLHESGFRCERCGRGGPLHVHHLTYAHRGDELEYPWDLIVLCGSCHDDAHPEAA